jgi:hypothetical protein
VGLKQVVRRMKEFATNKHAEPAFWKPARLIESLARSGQAFDDVPQRSARG